ncbi:EEF1A lysine methyltransferase 4-like [Dendronephthya gigantea]|uniref:EEF1A lysine methyltransferase 4-like n=1 Tax=Dendronephthya gigantea TaxID=151771 RepID=UPI00106B157C|nr:EEF1A lysine methyltransferase 4-like [Dendronephthya gigantea]
MDLPDSSETYMLKEYWNKRFAVEDNFEWCKSYCDFRHLTIQHVRKCDRILMLGCGNSRLSEEMYNDGYTNIVNIDYSPVVIEKMRQKHQELIGMEYLQMDITKMTFDKNSFDVIIEKGTLDTLLVDEKNLWNPSEHSRKFMHTVLLQISQILKIGGRFISVAFSQPHFRKLYLAKSEYNWSITTNIFGYYFRYFFYVMEKGRELSNDDKNLEVSQNKKICEGDQQCISFSELEEDNDENFLKNISNIF